jgi:prepilin-type N-terminal cleavage/methylation domain-containing protein
MGLRRDSRRGRGGFTLIELLVVMAIIAVLVSLTAAAVLKFLAKGPEIQNRTDIGQLDTALASARTEFGLTGDFPSFLVLREDGIYDTVNNPAHRQTVKLLKKMFGNRFDVRRPRDWNADTQITQGDIVLEGHHCLVFFLGGIPTPPGTTEGCTGFNSDNTQPEAASPSGVPRRGPWFNFQAKRLVRDTNGFYYYTDAYGKPPTDASGNPLAAFPKGVPYAYFAARTGNNDYFFVAGPPPQHDCPSLASLGLVNGPYLDRANRFINPNGHQIISAGPDTLFGPGGPWDPTAGSGQGPGADDMANFSGAPLGSPQQ